MKNNLILLMIILFLLTGCFEYVRPGGRGIEVQKLVPAEVDVSEYKKIAILDFDGRGGRQIAEWMESELQNARVGNKSYFEVISRSQMMKLLGEQMLSLQGFVDPRTAARMGRISGTQAIVTGRVSAFVVRDGHYYRNVTTLGTRGPRVERIRCQVRDAYVEFTASFIDSITGRVVAKTSAEGQYVGESCPNAGGLTGLLTQNMMDAIFQSVEKKTENVKVGPMDIPERMLKDASMLAIKKFVNKITPHYEKVRVVLKKNDSGLGLKVWEKKPESEKIADSYYDIAYRYAVRGQWEDAIEQWEKVLEIKEFAPAAVYNIGIAYEMLGELLLAESQLKKACDMKADNDFFDALARVRRTIREREEICRQTGQGCVKKASQIEVPLSDKVREGRPEVEQLPRGEQKQKPSIQPMEEEETPSEKMFTLKYDANVRKYASTNAGIVYTLKQGSIVEKIYEQKDWIYINFDDRGRTIKGWIHRCVLSGESIPCPVPKRKKREEEKEKPATESPKHPSIL